jgi:uncharacterized DUF497 family protein
MARNDKDEISFEWNEDKRTRIFAERGIDFREAAKILLNRVYEY